MHVHKFKFEKTHKEKIIGRGYHFDFKNDLKPEWCLPLFYHVHLSL